jgi:hypothetical protein
LTDGVPSGSSTEHWFNCGNQAMSDRLPILYICLAAPAILAACQQTEHAPRATWSGPLPSLDKIEECRGGDLSRSYGSTVKFHLYDCWADVLIDDMGRVTAFKPEDAAVCEQVLARC